MLLKELKTLIKLNKINAVFSGRVAADYKIIQFGEIPDCECGWADMKSWEDVEDMPDSTYIMELTCYDEYKQPISYTHSIGWLYCRPERIRVRSDLVEES